MRFLSLLLGALLMTNAASAAAQPIHVRRQAGLAAGHPWRRRSDRARAAQPRGGPSDPRRAEPRARSGLGDPGARRRRARRGRGGGARARGRSPFQRRPRLGLHLSGHDRDGRLDHGRQQPQCRRGHRRHRDPQPDRPRPPGDGAQPARLPRPARAPTNSRASRGCRRSRPNISRPPSAAASSRSCARGPAPSISTSI